jgi:two-component system chemotaxis response regulator CheY
MSSSSLIDLSGVRVLCVDDDPLMRAVVRAALQKRGCTTIEQAQGGHEALALCANNTFDLVICDFQMAPMDGLGFLSALCDAGHGAGWPVIMLSAEADPAKIAAAQELGISAWVAKPISVTRLVERIGAVLGLGATTGAAAKRQSDQAAERFHTQLMAVIAAVEEQLMILPYHPRDLAPRVRGILNALEQMHDHARTLGYGLVGCLIDRAAALLSSADRRGELLRQRHAEITAAVLSIVKAIRRVAQKRIAGDGGVAGLKLLSAIDDSIAPLRAGLV